MRVDQHMGNQEGVPLFLEKYSCGENCGEKDKGAI